MPETATKKSNYYPHLVVKNNEHPHVGLAFPFFGILFKFIITLPVLVYIILLSIVYIVLNMIVPFVILFKGKYWDTAYEFNVGFLKLSNKISLYFYGLTDKYPGFGMSDDGLFELTIEKPTAPSKLLGFPLLGFLIRMILLIPFSIFKEVLSNGAGVAMLCSWFAVLFKKKYPESLYEFNVDTLRVSNASYIYGAYMSDKYPSFTISMNHQTVKVLLIIAGTLLMLANFTPPKQPANYDEGMQNQMYDNTGSPTDNSTTKPKPNSGS